MQKIVTTLVSDLDGGDAAETVCFGLDGTDYEIDLSRAQAEEFRAGVGKYLANAREAAPEDQRTRRRRRQRQAPGKANDIRAWARGRGIQVKDYGRIPDEIQAEYAAAHADVPVGAAASQ
jgi:hypothetical protein